MNQGMESLIGINHESNLPRVFRATNDQSQSVVQTLDKLFPEQKRQDKNILQAKEILGDIADEFTPDQLKCLVTDVSFLVESWLDEFERNTFHGLTLLEFLHEKGNK